MVQTRPKSLLAIVPLLLVTTLAWAFDFSTSLAPGLKSSRPSADDRSISLRNVNGQMASGFPVPKNAGLRSEVFIFLTHDCPIANAYAPEIVRIEKKFNSARVKFFEVYSEADLTPHVAAEHHRTFGFRGTGLLDPKTTLAQRLHARVSPEVVVLGPDSNLIYQGRIDNTYAAVGVRRMVTTKHELYDLLEAVSRGAHWHKPSEPTPALGCTLLLKN